MNKPITPAHVRSCPDPSAVVPRRAQLSPTGEERRGQENRGEQRRSELPASLPSFNRDADTKRGRLLRELGPNWRAPSGSTPAEECAAWMADARSVAIAERQIAARDERREQLLRELAELDEAA